MTAAGDPGRSPRINASHLKIVSNCERELYLSEHARDERTEPSEFNLGLRDQGRDHERGMCERFPGLVGPIYRHDGHFDEAVAETLRHLRESRAPLYQPAFLSPDGTRSGVPDFLSWEDGALVVCDAKLARHVLGRADISLQMAHYRSLIEDATSIPVARCEVLTGDGQHVTIAPVERAVLERQVERARALLAPGPEPMLLKAHSTCGNCAFYDHCWTPAVAAGWLEVLPAVRADALAPLHAAGLRTVHDVVALGDRPLALPGIKTATIDRIRQESRAWAGQHAVWVAPHGLPLERARVWFDLEGDPGNDSDVPVYLWGAALDRPGDDVDYLPIFAEPGLDGDRAGWERFLTYAASLFARHPDAAWVHYSDYEKTYTRKYLERHGDRDGVGARILGALVDLLPALRRSAVLPLRSYSIKQVAPWLGFAWSHEEMGSQWSTVQYLKARATVDEDERRRLFDDLAAYNRDDLLAMKRVWEWMAREGPAGAPPVAKRKRTRSGRA